MKLASMLQGHKSSMVQYNKMLRFSSAGIRGVGQLSPLFLFSSESLKVDSRGPSHLRNSKFSIMKKHFVSFEYIEPNAIQGNTTSCQISIALSNDTCPLNGLSMMPEKTSLRAVSPAKGMVVFPTLLQYVHCLPLIMTRHLQTQFPPPTILHSSEQLNTSQNWAYVCLICQFYSRSPVRKLPFGTHKPSLQFISFPQGYSPIISCSVINHTIYLVLSFTKQSTICSIRGVG